MNLLLFAGYLLLFCWLVTRIKFFNRSGLSPALLITVFLLKVIAGIFYGWIGVHYDQKDTWNFHALGLEEKRLLIQNPAEFVVSLFRSNYAVQYGGFLSVENSWWNDLDLNFFNKLLAVFDIFSFNNYYINVIYYSFITLIGPIALYRWMTTIFPDKKTPVFLSIFLLPSFIYWTSGIHKDGLIFTGLTTVIYCFYFSLHQRRLSFKHMVLIITGLLLILILRNFLILFLVPGIIAWILAEKLKKKPAYTFACMYFLFAILFFTAKYIHPTLDFPQAVVNRQQAFLHLLGGGSKVAVVELQPTVFSFVKNVPQAISLSSLRPYLTDAKDILSLATAAEIMLLLFFFLLFLIWRQPGVRLSPVLLFCLFFSFSVLMSIGYTVNFLGAIVRYRSIVLPLLVIPMMASINWKRIQSLFFANIINKNNI